MSTVVVQWALFLTQCWFYSVSALSSTCCQQLDWLVWHHAANYSLHIRNTKFADKWQNDWVHTWKHSTPRLSTRSLQRLTLWSVPVWPPCSPQQRGRAVYSWSSACGCWDSAAGWQWHSGTGSALDTKRQGMVIHPGSVHLNLIHCIHLNAANRLMTFLKQAMSLPSVSRSTLRFWKMSICEECAMVVMLGVNDLLWMWMMACMPTYSTRALISGML